MIGPSLDAKGGVSSVASVYRASGLFEAWNVQYLTTTHVEGTLARKAITGAGALSRFIALLLLGRVGLLHAHVSERVSFWRKALFMLAALAFGRPVVFHLHGNGFVEFYRDETGRVGKWLIRFLLRRSACVIALSQRWVENVRAICPDAEVTRVFNPVSVGDGATPESARDPATLLFLGRFGQRKGIYDLLQAMVGLAGEIPDLVLRCGGDGEVAEVAATAERLGIGARVEVLGWVIGDRKRRLLESATVFVLPSYNEGLPMGILEALSCGLPVVATDVGGIPDAVTDGVEGFVVPAGDVAALGGALRKLLGDSDLLRRCSRAAIEKARTSFSTAAVIPQVAEIYRRLLACD
jgi:glycosyltransferase involved in cell wall biosynthesis